MLRRLGLSRAVTRTHRAFVSRHRARVQLEELESRNLLSVFTPLELRTPTGLELIGLSANTRAMSDLRPGQTIEVVGGRTGMDLSPGTEANLRIVVNIGSWYLGSPWTGSSMAVISFSDQGLTLLGQQSATGLTQNAPTVANLVSKTVPALTLSLNTGNNNVVEVVTPTVNLEITNVIANTVNASVTAGTSNSASSSANSGSGNGASSRTLSSIALGGSTLGNVLTGATVTATLPTTTGQNPAILPGDVLRILQTVSTAGATPTFTVQSGTALADNLLRPLVPTLNSTLTFIPPTPSFRIDNGGGGMGGVLDVVPREAPVLPVEPAQPVDPQKPAESTQTDEWIQLFDAYFGQAYVADQAAEPVAAAAPVADEGPDVDVNPAFLAACALFCFSGGALAEDVRVRDRRGMKK